MWPYPHQTVSVALGPHWHHRRLPALSRHATLPLFGSGYAGLGNGQEVGSETIESINKLLEEVGSDLRLKM